MHMVKWMFLVCELRGKRVDDSIILCDLTKSIAESSAM